MSITHLNNPLTAKHHGRSIIPFADRIAHPPRTTPSRRTNSDHTTRALRLGHVHLKVRHLSRSVAFYTSILGLRLTESVGRHAFLATDHEHHSVALEEIGAWAVNPSRRAVGMAHVAFEVPDRAAFDRMRLKLSQEDVPIISRNNGISLTMRFKDPDENEIEIYVDRRHAPGGTMLWKGHWHAALSSANEIEPQRRATA